MLEILQSLWNSLPKAGMDSPPKWKSNLPCRRLVAKQLVDSLSSKGKFVCQMIKILQMRAPSFFIALGPLSLLWAPLSTVSISLSCIPWPIRTIHVGDPHIPLAARNKDELPIVPKFYVWGPPPKSEMMPKLCSCTP